MNEGSENKKFLIFSSQNFSLTIWKSRKHLTFWQLLSHCGILEHFRKWNSNRSVIGKKFSWSCFFHNNVLEYRNDWKLVRWSNSTYDFILVNKKRESDKIKIFLIFGPQIHRNSFVIGMIKFCRFWNHIE